MIGSRGSLMASDEDGAHNGRRAGLVNARFERARYAVAPEI
jgi:hypothetical protein